MQSANRSFRAMQLLQPASFSTTWNVVVPLVGGVGGLHQWQRRQCATGSKVGKIGGGLMSGRRNFHYKNYFTMSEARNFVDRLKLAFTGNLADSVPREKLFVDFSQNEEPSAKWLMGSDSDWGGRSLCQLNIEEGEAGNKAMKFSGSLSLAIPLAQARPGIIYGTVSQQPVKSGMCAFGSRRYILDGDLQHFNALKIRVKGDGRTYLVNLRTGALREQDLYQTIIKPAPGVWQTLVLPFKNFILTHNGMINLSPGVMNLRQVTSFGVSIMDRKDGPFQILLQSAHAVRDDSIDPIQDDGFRLG